MIIIYHNPRCTKSRQGLEVLQKSGKAFKIIKYLEDIPRKSELENIIKLLGIKPIDLIRKNEKIWKESFKEKYLSDAEIIDTMLQHPKLIERPIIINKNQAVIGRPTELILDII